MKLLKYLSRMHVLQFSFVSMIFLAITLLFNGCASVLGVAGENIGDITKINTYFENGEAKLNDVLSKLNKPDFEIRDYNFKVTRQIYSATLSDSDKKLVIVQYSVDSTETDHPYRTLKDAVLLLDGDTIDKNSIIKEVKYFGAAYLNTMDQFRYYVMSDTELKIWTNLGYRYLSGNNKTGYFKPIPEVNEFSVIKDQVESLYGPIGFLEPEDGLNMLGSNGYKNSDAYPEIQVVTGSAVLFTLSLINTAAQYHSIK
jgi:hypothetical protein